MLPPQPMTSSRRRSAPAPAPEPEPEFGRTESFLLTVAGLLFWAIILGAIIAVFSYVILIFRTPSQITLCPVHATCKDGVTQCNHGYTLSDAGGAASAFLRALGLPSSEQLVCVRNYEAHKAATKALRATVRHFRQAAGRYECAVFRTGTRYAIPYRVFTDYLHDELIKPAADMPTELDRETLRLALGAADAWYKDAGGEIERMDQTDEFIREIAFGGALAGIVLEGSLLRPRPLRPIICARALLQPVINHPMAAFTTTLATITVLFILYRIYDALACRMLVSRIAVPYCKQALQSAALAAGGPRAIQSLHLQADCSDSRPGDARRIRRIWPRVEHVLLSDSRIGSRRSPGHSCAEVGGSMRLEFWWDVPLRGSAQPRWRSLSPRGRQVVDICPPQLAAGSGYSNYPPY